jgi:hypothetical protein
MKAKILYTDGERTVELFWVKHNGTDVYCGPPKNDFKLSYHASGKLHTKDGESQLNANWVAPLNDLKGTFHLMTLAFTNSKTYVQTIRREFEFKGSKLDTVLVIDARSIPENMFVNVMVGLVEAGNSAAVGLLSMLPNVKQLLLGMQVSPWVSAAVMWPIEGFDVRRDVAEDETVAPRELLQ